MALKNAVSSFAKRFKLDSHHAIERFGVIVGTLSLLGVLILGGTGISSYQNAQATLSERALYTNTFTTSKTALDGEVVGVYRDAAGDRVLVMMSFGAQAQISYEAANYEAFLLGSDAALRTEPVATEGIEGAFHVFGSSGYVGVVLDAAEPFDRQVLNLTMRANAELSLAEDTEGEADVLASDSSFAAYDQWRIFFNPGASEALPLEALDAETFDPAAAYDEIVLRDREVEARAALDAELVTMRAQLAQIDAYTAEAITTRVDSLALETPEPPAFIAEDTITGNTAAEVEALDDGAPADDAAAAGGTEGIESTLALETDEVAPAGYDFDWRSGSIAEGYLDDLLAPGESASQYLSARADESDASTRQEIAALRWMLSDGSDLQNDYRASDVAMRPLMNVMNNLTQAYMDYAQTKTTYQVDLLLGLLELEIELRNVQTNTSSQSDSFLWIHGQD